MEYYPDFLGSLRDIIKTLDTWNMALEQTDNKIKIIFEPLRTTKSPRIQRDIQRIDPSIYALKKNNESLQNLIFALKELADSLSFMEND